MVLGNAIHGFTVATTAVIAQTVKEIYKKKHIINYKCATFLHVKLTCNVSSKAMGKTSSTWFISLENLFNILPDGFALKNLIVAYTIL